MGTFNLYTVDRIIALFNVRLIKTKFLFVSILLFIYPLFIKDFRICAVGQTIPVGISLDSIYPIEMGSSIDKEVRVKLSFYYYKPTSYNPVTSPILFAIHGVGGNGLSEISDLSIIADRRNALIIAPNLELSSGIRHQIADYTLVDSIENITARGSATDYFKCLYKHVLARESRTSINSYLIGFSAGGQFVTRYMIFRQAYPDSIPLKMAVSSNPYYYTFPTDTFNSVPMPWYCGLLFDFSLMGNYRYNTSFYSFNCPENIKQYYAENYAVLIGTADNAVLSDNACGMAQGNSRYQRAQSFFNFCQSDAASRGTPFNWQYKEILGIGHDQYGMYNSKDSVNDPYTIAEKLLFDSPFVPNNQIAPIAGFYATNRIIYLPSPAAINFTNTSSLATNYIWDFGDGTTSSQANPIHTFPAIAGLYTVQLTAINSNGCDTWHVERFYIEVKDTSKYSPACFSAETNYTVGNYPEDICSADFNSDGKMDLAVANAGSNSISILNGDGAGNFIPAVNYPLSEATIYLISADFNNDGKLDLATTDALNKLWLLLGNGDGTFSAASGFLVGNKPMQLVSADFNLDGKQDVITLNINSYDISILLGNGFGGFLSITNFPMSNGINGLSVEDYNLDGKPDLAISNFSNRKAEILLGNGLGGFSIFGNNPLETGPIKIIGNDFNTDGKPDLAVFCSGSGYSILLGNGDGTFEKSNTILPWKCGSPFSIADMNMDENIDLIGINGSTFGVIISTGDGTGSFNAPIKYSNSHEPFALTLADFNSDNKPDIATPNFSTHNITILLNTFIPKPNISQSGNILSSSETASTYKWYFNGTLIAGASNKTLDISQTGNGIYSLNVGDSNTCQNKTSDLFSATGVGIHKHISEVPEFAIIPNPSTGKFEISTNGLDNFQIEISNVLGEVIYENDNTGINKANSVGNLHEVDLSNKAKGIYFVKVSSPNNICVKKVVLQ